MTTEHPGLLLKALGFAARKHRDQRRKDPEASPYINHPIALANVLANEAAVTDPVVLAAATPMTPSSRSASMTDAKSA